MGDPTRSQIVAFAFVIAYRSPAPGRRHFTATIFLASSCRSDLSLISNVIAGHTLVYRRAFHVGDMVKIQTPW
jgi:hypothetical protein